MNRGVIPDLVIMPIAQATNQFKLITDLIFILRKDGVRRRLLREIHAGIIASERRCVLRLVLPIDNHTKGADR